jgi:hypothetical protein
MLRCINFLSIAPAAGKVQAISRLAGIGPQAKMSHLPAEQEKATALP